MRHKSREVGRGTRGSEGERKGERERRRDIRVIGVIGGSRDRWNREEKGGKRAILSHLYRDIK